MTFWSILALLVLVAGLVAYVGDMVAKRVGKRHWRFLGLRPRATATLVAVGTGMLIAIGAFGTFFLLAKTARETILEAETVRQERDRLRTEVGRLENRAAQTFAENEQLKIDRSEFERNNFMLARQLEQNADLQRQTRQDLEQVLAEREKLQQEVDRLQTESVIQRQALAGLEQSREQLQSEKAQLRASRERLLEQANKAQTDLRNLQAASQNALTQFNSLEARTKELNGRIRQLEADKRTLEGDVSVLVSNNGQSLESKNNDLSDTLRASQQDNADLKAKLADSEQQLLQLRSREKQLVNSLDKTLRLSLLAEQPLEPGSEADALKEVVRRADIQARVLGLRGLAVTETPSLIGLKPGLLLARAAGVNPDGKVRVRVEYRAKEQLFAEGDILATGILVVPASMNEMRRRLDILSQAAEEKLSQAGWIPEKLAQGGISFEELVNFTSLLSSKRGGARVAVVALDNLYPTDPPKLGLKLLQ
ncbi:MAG: DUF3084 domain-containing protein [Thermaceae bacterium]|nr:DUF3084 domain-containing protein [Thermaceae bacterium]